MTSNEELVEMALKQGLAPGQFPQAFSRIREAEAKLCKHAKYKSSRQAEELIPSMAKFAGAASCADAGKHQDLALEEYLSFLTLNTDQLCTREAYQAAITSAVNAFLQWDFIYSRGMFLCAILIENALPTHSFLQAMGAAASEETVRSEIELLQALQRRVPCRCLDVEDPKWKYFTPDRACPAGDRLEFDPTTKPRYYGKDCASCHEPFTSPKQCSRCHLVGYCCSDCQLRDWKLHKPYCAKHPTWWGKADEQK